MGFYGIIYYICRFWFYMCVNLMNNQQEKCNFMWWKKKKKPRKISKDMYFMWKTHEESRGKWSKFMVVLCLANLSQPKDAQKSLAILPAAEFFAALFPTKLASQGGSTMTKQWGLLNSWLNPVKKWEMFDSQHQRPERMWGLPTNNVGFDAKNTSVAHVGKQRSNETGASREAKLGASWLQCAPRKLP